MRRTKREIRKVRTIGPIKERKTRRVDFFTLYLPFGKSNAIY
jgi:hypothetical protein